MTLGVGAGRVREHETLVGRAAALTSFEQVLDDLDRGRPAAVELVGEPGIGKTRLLRELASRAERRGHLVLYGSASELERDLPFSVLVDALDEYVEGLEAKRLGGLDDDVQAELAHVFPSLAPLAAGRSVAVQHERYRSHRAIRVLLESLAAARPLVLMFDDLQWADSASVEVLGALLRRPPAAAVLTAFAHRPRQLPDRFSAALARAQLAATLTCIELDALSATEAHELLGDTVAAADAALLYEESGGNPFYLEQLARSLERLGGAPRAAPSEIVDTGIDIPRAVAASLNDELTGMSEGARLVLDGAAVAGDPFELELATAAASTSEAAALDALDELLRLDLIRTTEVPRRFRFRHPLLRRAVYAATAAGWRLGAHGRCAEALAARGATVAARAHHVARSAPEGDLAAVALLREAGESSARLAPGSAARWFAEALRLLPPNAPDETRIELLVSRSGALTAAGSYVESHSALVEALAIAPEESHATQAALTRACAAVEGNLGWHEQARRRLETALDALPESGSPEAVALMIDLGMNGLWRASYTAMREWAKRAVDAARPLGDAPLTAAALAVLALGESMSGAAERAEADRSEAAELVESLSDADVARRLDAPAWLAGAELYLDRYVEADAHAGRALAVARATGQGELFLVLVQMLGRVWLVRGKLADAAELLDGGTEAARLLGNTQAVVWNLFNRAPVALAVGDVDLAFACAEESVDLSRELGQGFHSAWAAARLAGVLLDTGDPERAAELLLGSAGGEALELIPGSWRAYCLELLTRCRLALERRDEAERSVAEAYGWASAVQLPLADAWADRAAASLALHDGDTERAAGLALASATTADDVGAPIEAAFARTLAGRALARCGRRDVAVAELRRAAEAMDACGALRYRDQAERELGTLGHRTYRRTRPGQAGEPGVASLTERELQVARLVVDRKTNAEIAAELFLSRKTVETHLRNSFRKLGVSTRVALAREVERADRAASAGGVIGTSTPEARLPVGPRERS